jgi:acyl-CoA reductase-like NAD-dependent aldehyde dehydrogenase
MDNPTVAAPELALIQNIVARQRAYFKKGETLKVDFRLRYLKKLRDAILLKEDVIHEALHKDLGKSAPEAFVTETGIIMNELNETISSTVNWAKPRKVNTPLFFLPGTSKIHPEPYGNTLIIAPWNYPYQLLMSPLIGAIAAGNTVVVKPSEVSPHITAVVKEILESVFPPEYVAVVEGGVPESTALLNEKWDYIFFTGSTHVGRIVYQAAAKHLTPVTLELGGKSPCIVDKDIHLENTARRIVWGKFVNLGQTCIAPDYLMVHKDIKEKLVNKIQEKLQQFYGENPQQSEDYGRIVSHRHFDRLVRLMDQDKIIYGGQTDRDDRYISPTLLDGVSPDDPIMQEEIFGPILPMMEWENLDEVVDFVNNRDKPLALYVYTRNNKISDRVLTECSSGGACINDSVVHIGNPNLPFGGVGASGIGAYHGRASFDTFSHLKSVMHRSASIDLDIRYAPWGKNYSKLKFLVKKFL